MCCRALFRKTRSSHLALPICVICSFISVDGWLRFTAPGRVAVLVNKLREIVDRCGFAWCQFTLYLTFLTLWSYQGARGKIRPAFVEYPLASSRRCSGDTHYLCWRGGAKIKFGNSNNLSVIFFCEHILIYKCNSSLQRKANPPKDHCR